MFIRVRYIRRRTFYFRALVSIIIALATMVVGSSGDSGGNQATSEDSDGDGLSAAEEAKLGKDLRWAPVQPALHG